MTIDSDVTLHLGDVPIELKIMGPAHSTNDIGVWLPEQKVMFAGDLAFSGGHPIFLEGSVAGFRSAAERMKALAPNALLPGHGPACRGDEVGKVLDDLIGYADWIAELARESYAAGLTPLEAAQKAAGGPPLRRLARGRAGRVQPAPRLRGAEPGLRAAGPAQHPEPVARDGRAQRRPPITTHA